MPFGNLFEPLRDRPLPGPPGRLPKIPPRPTPAPVPPRPGVVPGVPPQPGGIGPPPGGFPVPPRPDTGSPEILPALPAPIVFPRFNPNGALTIVEYILLLEQLCQQLKAATLAALQGNINELIRILDEINDMIDRLRHFGLGKPNCFPQISELINDLTKYKNAVNDEIQRNNNMMDRVSKFECLATVQRSNAPHIDLGLAQSNWRMMVNELRQRVNNRVEQLVPFLIRFDQLLRMSDKDCKEANKFRGIPYNNN